MKSTKTEILEGAFLTRRWIQYVAVVSATLAMFSSGAHFVWTSPSLPKLYANDSSIPTTVEEGSWLASISLLGDLLGAPFGAIVADKMGRKHAIVLTAIPYLLAWLMIAFANSMPVLLIARFIVGIGDGSSYTIQPMYIGEVADNDIRGKLGNCIAMMADLGSLYVYCIGPYVSIRTMALLGSIFPVLLIATMPFMPESPYQLIAKKKKDRARVSLQRLRGKENVEEELSAMYKVVEEQMLKSTSWKEVLCVRSNLRALLIVIGLKTIQQLSGISAFLVYSELIFEQAAGGISSSISAIVFGAVQFASSFLSAAVVDLVGRRPLLVVSCLGTAVALAAQGTYFYLQYIGSDVSYLSWLPVTSMILFIVMYSVGLGPISYMMPSELFPTNVKAKALCLMDLYLCMAAFGVTKVYPIVAASFGSHVPFFGFCICSILGVVFVILCVPETKEKSLEEIQDLLKKKKNKKDEEYVITKF